MRAGGATDGERGALVEATGSGDPHFQVTLVDELAAAALRHGRRPAGIAERLKMVTGLTGAGEPVPVTGVD